jgi:hypothetical protein
LKPSTTHDAPKSNQAAIKQQSSSYFHAFDVAISAIGSDERVHTFSTGENGGVSRRTSSRVIRFCTVRFIAARVFLMVNGDHTPVTINGCKLPQL